MPVDECEGDCVAAKFTCGKELPASDNDNDRCRMMRCEGAGGLSGVAW